MSRATLYRWSRQGRLKLYRLGPRATRVREEDLGLLEAQAEPLHDGDLWTQAGEQDLAGGLREIEQQIPASALKAYLESFESLGVPVRFDANRGEFQIR